MLSGSTYPLCFVQARAPTCVTKANSEKRLQISCVVYTPIVFFRSKHAARHCHVGEPGPAMPGLSVYFRRAGEEPGRAHGNLQQHAHDLQIVLCAKLLARSPMPAVSHAVHCTGRHPAKPVCGQLFGENASSLWNVHVGHLDEQCRSPHTLAAVPVQQNCVSVSTSHRHCMHLSALVQRDLVV